MELSDRETELIQLVRISGDWDLSLLLAFSRRLASAERQCQRVADVEDLLERTEPHIAESGT